MKFKNFCIRVQNCCLSLARCATITAKPWMKSATCCGMKSRRSLVCNHHEVMYGINPKEDTRWRVIIKRSESASLLVSERVQIALRAFRQRRNIARSAAVQTVGEQRVCHAVALRRIPYTLRVIPYQSFGLDRKKQVFRLAFFLAPPAGLEPATS